MTTDQRKAVLGLVAESIQNLRDFLSSKDEEKLSNESWDKIWVQLDHNLSRAQLTVSDMEFTPIRVSASEFDINEARRIVLNAYRALFNELMA